MLLAGVAWEEFDVAVVKLIILHFRKLVAYVYASSIASVAHKAGGAALGLDLHRGHSASSCAAGDPAGPGSTDARFVD